MVVTDRSRKLLLALAAFLLMLDANWPLQAQNTGELSGTVLDPDNRAIPKATITLSRRGAATAVGAADDFGGFRLTGLAPGDYELTVSHEAFKPSKTKVRIGGSAATLAPLSIHLQLADVQTDVTVNSQTTQVSTNASDNQDAVTLGRQALDDLPIFDQDYIGTMSRFLDAGSIATGGTTIIVDGVEASRALVSASAIQEVKINQDPYSAEYPRPGRSRIEIITKPGSPDFHGTVNFLFRDSHLNARDPFALTRPPEQRRIFEGSLTGPVGSGGKTSFLISANREEEDLQAVVFADGVTGPIQLTVPQPSRNTELSASLTRSINENQVISIRGVYTDRTIHNQGAGGLVLPEAAANFEDREDILYFNHRGPIRSGRFYNLFRILVARQHTPTTSVNPAPKLVVLGAFTAGGAQADRLQTENHIAFNEILVWSGTRHTVRFGVNVPDISRRGLNDYTNTLGTYTFSTIQDYLARRPLSLVRQSGNGHVVFMEKVLGGFVQDEFKLRPNLQITAGLRYDWQNYFDSATSFAPRGSFAYSPGKSHKTVIRGGIGMFYDRSGPIPIFDLLRYDGVRLLQYVVSNPSFPDTGSLGPTSIAKLDPAVRIPYLIQYGGGIERQLVKRTTLAVNYYATRGIDLFRSRDVNAPPPPLYLARPNPRFSVYRQIESSADMKNRSLEIALRGQITRFFSGMAQYTLAESHNNTGGNPGSNARTSLNSFPANNYDLSGEWARADFDQRHRFNLLGSINPGRYFKLGAAVSLYTGMPYSMTTGRDDNHDGFANDRPAGVPRNSLQGPGMAQLDLRWSRDFFLDRQNKDKGPAVTAGLDAFNVLNHVNYAGYVGTVSSPFFGHAVSALPVRRLQASLRFRF